MDQDPAEQQSRITAEVAQRPVEMRSNSLQACSFGASQFDDGAPLTELMRLIHGPVA
jgi:hypothetical protein